MELVKKSTTVSAIMFYRIAHNIQHFEIFILNNSMYGIALKTYENVKKKPHSHTKRRSKRKQKLMLLLLKVYEIKYTQLAYFFFQHFRPYVLL